MALISKPSAILQAKFVPSTCNKPHKEDQYLMCCSGSLPTVYITSPVALVNFVGCWYAKLSILGLPMDRQEWTGHRVPVMV